MFAFVMGTGARLLPARGTFTTEPWQMVSGATGTCGVAATTLAQVAADAPAGAGNAAAMTSRLLDCISSVPLRAMVRLMDASLTGVGATTGLILSATSQIGVNVAMGC